MKTVSSVRLTPHAWVLLKLQFQKFCIGIRNWISIILKNLIYSRIQLLKIVRLENFGKYFCTM